jgi:3-hydroxybutyryl-CoA dehydrogenase
MSSDRTIETFAVLGAGVMGAGIAEVFARAGHEVRVFDPRGDVAAAVADSLAEHGVSASADVEDAVAGASIVIEAATENLEVKLGLLRRVGVAAPDAIVASNTSTFQPSRLAGALGDPSRLLVAHFFNPATVIPLVEVVPSEHTAPSVVERMLGVLRGAGKQPVLLRRETEGFIANRLQAAIVREAFALWRDGVADPETIDAVVTGGLGPRWAVAGPFRVMDLGGLDVWRALAAELFPVLSTATAPPAELESLVDSGSLGAKSGAGFYEHDADASARFVERVRRSAALAQD